VEQLVPQQLTLLASELAEHWRWSSARRRDELAAIML
jgi:hypothetical protein